MTWLLKIVSGGQTGADQGGLEAGKYLGLETGGWMPKNFMTEDGPRPDFVARYGVREHSSPRYPPRTTANVRDAQATVWFGKTGSAGYRCASAACNKYERRLLVVCSPKDLRDFIEAHRIRILNVAGNRESKNPGLRELVIRTFLEAFGEPVPLSPYVP